MNIYVLKWHTEKWSSYICMFWLHYTFIYRQSFLFYWSNASSIIRRHLQIALPEVLRTWNTTAFLSRPLIFFKDEQVFLKPPWKNETMNFSFSQNSHNLQGKQNRSFKIFIFRRACWTNSPTCPECPLGIDHNSFKGIFSLIQTVLDNHFILFIKILLLE